MASLDAFSITLRGKSCHASMPENGADPVVAAAQLMLALQTIPARRLFPLASAVVSITQINGGEAINVIPEDMVLRGTLHCLQSDVQVKVRKMIDEFFTDLTAPLGIVGNITYLTDYPVTCNHAAEAEKVKNCALALLPAGQVDCLYGLRGLCLYAGSLPWCLFLDSADSTTPSRPLHNAYYDFNDDIIAEGVALWTGLAEQLLPLKQAPQP